MTNNYAMGTVRNPFLSPAVWSKCACEGAWQNAQECHQPENMATGWPGDQRAICPSWRRSHFFYKDWYVDNRIEEGELEHLLNTSARNTIYAGTALAYKGAMLNFSHIRHRWFDRE